MGYDMEAKPTEQMRITELKEENSKLRAEVRELEKEVVILEDKLSGARKQVEYLNYLHYP